MIRWFSIPAILVLSGCSPLITASGKYGSILSPGVSRSEIRSVLGAPVRSDGAQEEYAAHGKIRRPLLDAESEAMMIGCTFLLAELYYFPKAVLDALADMRSDQIVRVEYDASGTYSWHSVTRCR